MYLLKLLQNAAKSKLGQMFFLIQLILVTIAFAKRGYTFILIHPSNESILFNTLIVLNLPALFTGGIFTIPFALISKELADFYIYPFMLFLCCGIQWLLIGYGTEKLVKRFVTKNQIK